MSKHRNLSIISVAGLTSALAISAFGAGAVATDAMGDGARMGAIDIEMDGDRVLLSGERESDHGEGSETVYAADDVYDETVDGVRLLLAYDAESNSFGGLVENTTDAILEGVGVEVDLSNGGELGPTEPADLAPGEVIEVVLPATDEPFDSFSAHPEIGAEYEDEDDDYEDDEEEYEDGDDDEYEDDDDDD